MIYFLASMIFISSAIELTNYLLSCDSINYFRIDQSLKVWQMLGGKVFEVWTHAVKCRAEL
jgi:hypothetical protein